MICFFKCHSLISATLGYKCEIEWRYLKNNFFTFFRQKETGGDSKHKNKDPAENQEKNYPEEEEEEEGADKNCNFFSVLL